MQEFEWKGGSIARQVGVAAAALVLSVALCSAQVPNRFKAVWEPVSYKQDLDLHSVFFVTPDIGWASGDFGTIIKTRDGGATWTAQLGGTPGSDAKAINDLRFIDHDTGFAAQVTGTGDHTLLRTTDGENWEATGTVGQHRGDYIFTSAEVGFQSARNQILATTDAGRTWRPVMNCATTVQVGGLTRNVRCEMENFDFPNPQIGYAMGPAAGAKGVFMAKTENGGANWELWMVLPDESGHEGHLFFTDANNGVMCVIGGKLFATSDGGKTWRGIAGNDCPGKPEIRFADPEVGMAVAGNAWRYTADGGKHWSSKAVSFPAAVNAFTLPRRDRAYAVGAHGMVYRYKVVPVTYTSAGAIDAPVVASFGSPLQEQVEMLLTQSQTLGGGSASAAAPAKNTATASATSVLGKVQALLDLIGANVPQFLARYRNLNLVFEGARTSAALPGWLETVKEGFSSFKSAPDKNAAQAALAQMMSAADSLRIETRLAFQTSAAHAP
jgi:photosystem II stability/assembly factor-like uncharacterized protein